MYMKKEIKKNGYVFGACCTKASYDKMNIESKTYQTLNFIKYNPFCTKKDVQVFLYGKSKYSSYGSFVWKNLLADGLIYKHRKGNSFIYSISTIGEGYIDYINRNHYSSNVKRKIRAS